MFSTFFLFPFFLVCFFFFFLKKKNNFNTMIHVSCFTIVLFNSQAILCRKNSNNNRKKREREKDKNFRFGG